MPTKADKMEEKKVQGPQKVSVKVDKPQSADNKVAQPQVQHVPTETPYTHVFPSK